MNSIRVILSGGLGNQLFQYATGRALAERTGAELLLDTITGFKYDKVYNRSYELDVFPGPKACRKAEIPSKRAWLWLRLRQRKRVHAIAKILKVVDEILHGPDLDQLSLDKGEHLLIGFWQEERYFSSIREALHKELALAGKGERGENEVAVHVRRVDYTRGVGEDYFSKAIEQMRQAIDAPRFILYTDDLVWGERFVQSHPDFQMGSCPGAAAIDDFQSLCQFRHFIISNSTFSWWAARLTEQKCSCILCPPGSDWANPLTPPHRWQF